MLSRKKYGKEVLSKSKKRRCTSFKSHVNKIGTNNLDTSKSDIVIGNSELPLINVQT